ncbi:MAG: hypothetical protein WC609_02925 [Candidatus Paceibacterota bacterium]|jgi:hypothetical protein
MEKRNEVKARGAPAVITKLNIAAKWSSIAKKSMPLSAKEVTF